MNGVNGMKKKQLDGSIDGKMSLPINNRNSKGIISALPAFKL